MATSCPNDAPEEPRLISKVGIFWDLESCHLPPGQTIESFAQRLRKYLISNLQSCEAQFTIICDIYKHQIHADAEQRSNIRLRHIDSSISEALNYKLLEEIRNFLHIYRNSNPSLILLCGGNIDFTGELLYYKEEIGCLITLVFGSFCLERLTDKWDESEVLDFDLLIELLQNNAQVEFDKVAQICPIKTTPETELQDHLNSNVSNTVQDLSKMLQNEEKEEVGYDKSIKLRRYFLAVFGFTSTSTVSKIYEHLTKILDEILSLPGTIEGIENQQGWISFPNITSAEVALEEINKMQICGRRLHAHLVRRLPKNIVTIASLKSDLDCDWRKRDDWDQASELLNEELSSEAGQDSLQTCPRPLPLPPGPDHFESQVITKLLEQSHIHETCVEPGSQMENKYYLHIQGIPVWGMSRLPVLFKPIPATLEYVKSGGAWFSFTNVQDAISATRRVIKQNFMGKKLSVEFAAKLPTEDTSRNRQQRRLTFIPNRDSKIVTLKVNNIPQSIEIDQIKLVFQDFLKENYTIGSVYCVKKGQALIRFPSDEVAQRVIPKFKNQKFFGQALRIVTIKTILEKGEVPFE